MLFKRNIFSVTRTFFTYDKFNSDLQEEGSARESKNVWNVNEKELFQIIFFLFCLQSKTERERGEVGIQFFFYWNMCIKKREKRNKNIIILMFHKRFSFIFCVDSFMTFVEPNFRIVIISMAGCMSVFEILKIALDWHKNYLLTVLYISGINRIIKHLVLVIP